ASIHTSTGSTYQWPWFITMAGKQNVYDTLPHQTESVSLRVVASSLATEGLPANWDQPDLFLNLKNADGSTVLLESNGEPVSWINDSDGGELFFTRAGGDTETYQHANFNTLLTYGIRYVLKGNALNYKKARSPRVPDETRFLQLTLDSYLDEPME